MPKQNPGERPTKKIMAAAAGETPKSKTRIVRTKPASPAMPGTRVSSPSPKWPPNHKALGLAHDPSEIDDTTEED